MRPNFRSLNNRAKSVLRGTTLLAGIGAVFVATAPAYAADADAIETVVVTGYRASLTASTDAKRASTNFSDSVFAEDIGKFPDSNIAEALNRIPGVTISREIDGSGINVSIRGLGTNFTKILLNGAQVSVASTGGTDQTNTNREVDLNMFPTELFTQLTVNKSAQADLVEGGAAGTLNMRSARPFDNEGAHFTYTFQGSQNSLADGLGAHGALIASDTWGDFGALVGVSGMHSVVMTTGWEDGNAGWVTPAQTAAQCQSGTLVSSTGAGSPFVPSNAACDAIGGNSMSIPGTVPANVTGHGLPAPGTTVDAALLRALNPALATTTGTVVAGSGANTSTYSVVNNVALSNMLLPRLGRDMYEKGSRDRINAVVSFEWRPSDDLHFYLDAIGGHTHNDLDRTDLDWGVRPGIGGLAMIPIGVTADANNVVTGGTFANAQFFIEARPYKETGDFWSVNPGMSWHPMELLSIDAQANYSRSSFYRDSPTVLVVSCPSAGTAAGVPGCTPPVGGVFATFTNAPGANHPTQTTNIDLNNPANFQWQNGRVNLALENRTTHTAGAHVDGKWGDDDIALKVGGAFDDVYRNIFNRTNDQQWQNAVCGDNPSVFLPGNGNPSCFGLNVPASGGTTAGNAGVVNATTPGTTSVPTYPGFGTGSTVGFAPVTYSGSLIPQSALASYLIPGPTGFITVNYPKFKTASHYSQFVANAPYSTSTATTANSGVVDEKTYGAYAELTGVLHLDTRNLRYNAGLRWIQTLQSISGPVTVVDPRNSGPPALADGGLYPNTFLQPILKHTYSAFLPSVNVVYEVAEDFQVRASVSRTMTRPNPNSMLPGLNFNDVTAQAANLGNPALKPFFSNNIDLGAELYTGGEGYIGATIFRKGLSGFTGNQLTVVPFNSFAALGITFSTLTATQQAALIARGCSPAGVCPDTVTVNVTQGVNQPGLLTVNGIELTMVQPLDFLLERHGLKGFGVTANVTILDQKGSGAAPAIATGISPFSYNLTGYYENNGLMMRMSYVFNDRVYASGSNQQSVCLPNTTTAPTCPAGAFLYGSPYGQADFSSSLKLSRLFGDLPSDPEMTFDVTNVFSAHLRSYDNFTNAVHNFYSQGTTYMFGIRGTF